AQQRYHDEAAIFQIEKVRTPTHIVGGAEDIRVAVQEDYLLDRALHELGIPSTLLVFPGEGHSLDKNPWHGKIKVREELKWLQKYGGVGRRKVTHNTCARIMCQMNVTLSIDEQLVARARKKAEALGKSLNQLIRDYLQNVAGGDDPERSIEEFNRLSGRGHSRGWRFNRDEIHERS